MKLPIILRSRDEAGAARPANHDAQFATGEQAGERARKWIDGEAEG